MNINPGIILWWASYFIAFWLWIHLKPHRLKILGLLALVIPGVNVLILGVALGIQKIKK
jgi:hypothetical protein